ncbi:hypothetical protein JW921_06515 [Candidatus Fermentibacterales bacterium]|nr:hypothetical protein [Candidatus Fermentibacterales bacterium]
MTASGTLSALVLCCLVTARAGAAGQGFELILADHPASSACGLAPLEDGLLVACNSPQGAFLLELASDGRVVSTVRSGDASIASIARDSDGRLAILAGSEGSWVLILSGDGSGPTGAFDLPADPRFDPVGVCPARDGGVIVAGTVAPGAFGAILLDSSGTFSQPSLFRVADFDRASCVTSTGDDGCLIVGTTRSQGVPGAETVVLRLDPDMTFPWCRRFASTGMSSPAAAISTRDGGFALAGAWTSAEGSADPLARDILLMRLDEAGSILWTGSYAGLGADSAVDLAQLEDGGFAVLAGTSDEPGEWIGTMLLRVDSQGGEIWTRYYTTRRWSCPEALLALPDGDLVCAGWTDPAGLGAEGREGQMIWVLRTGPDGFLREAGSSDEGR